jgi:hypothetical protein
VSILQELTKEEIRWLEHLFYEADNAGDDRAAEICEDPLILHSIVLYYNWDDGFEVPTAIMRNPHCDLGTALMMFHSAERWDLLAQPDRDLEARRQEGAIGKGSGAIL